MLKKQIFTKIKSSLASKKTRIILLSIFLAALSGLFTYNLLYFRKIYPGIYISGVSVSGLKQQEAIKILKSTISPPDKIYLTYDSETFEIDLETYNFYYDLEESTLLAYKIGRSGNIFRDLSSRLVLPFNKTVIPLTPRFDEKALSEHLSIIANEISQEPIYPTINLVDGIVEIEKGKPGVEIDYLILVSRISQALSRNINIPITIPTVVVDPTISDSEAEILRARAEKLIGKNIKLTFNNEEFLLEEDHLFSFLSDKNEVNQKDEVIKEISSKFDRETQNPVFVFESFRVVEFTPAKEGIKINAKKLSGLIIQKITELEASDLSSLDIEIPASVTPPDITTEEVNNLGIKELIGRGSSNFRGSIANRVFNIGHASSKFKGVLIAPGETFSFNNALGDVSSLTGYKQAFVIKDGKTVLGDGGGVCQVSSTFFRAALNAGLPIIERRAHSYRVSYYEQGYPPGLDATVYAPTTDLKVLNDTPGHILIQSIFDPQASTLTFEFYGTSDGRLVRTTKPIVGSSTPPPEDSYVDDPTLPAGQIKQIDYRAWGAKVSFTYEVERNGEIIYQKDFFSNYRPWQAVFLRGTKPVN